MRLINLSNMQVNVTHFDIFIDILTLAMLNKLSEMHIFLSARLFDFFPPLLQCTCIRTEAAWKTVWIPISWLHCRSRSVGKQCGSQSVGFSVNTDQLEYSVNADQLASV